MPCWSVRENIDASHPLYWMHIAGANRPSRVTGGMTPSGSSFPVSIPRQTPIQSGLGG